MEEKCYRSEQIGCFGCPIDENPTVVIMEAGFRALGLDYRYNTTLLRAEDLEDGIRGLRAFNMVGGNFTIPHKVEVIKYLDGLTATAQVIGAVNTVYFEDGKLMGDNSDGKGFLKSLADGDIGIAGKKVVILGAGGAARAISVELALAGTGEIVIVNRSEEKGNYLADYVSKNTPAKASFVLWDSTYEIPADTDILVNATNIGLFPDKSRPNIDYQTLTESMVVCDVIPNPPHTPFLAAAEKRGCRTFTGFGMLVNQAAINFKLWTGYDAPIEAMSEALYKEFAE